MMHVFVLSSWHRIQISDKFSSIIFICLTPLFKLQFRPIGCMIWWRNIWPWQLLLCKWAKHIFTVIIATVAKRARCFIRLFHVKLSKVWHPYFMDFLEIFISSRYHRDMKILKILASNSKWFRVSGIFKKWQIDDDREYIWGFVWEYIWGYIWDYIWGVLAQQCILH